MSDAPPQNIHGINPTHRVQRVQGVTIQHGRDKMRPKTLPFPQRQDQPPQIAQRLRQTAPRAVARRLPHPQNEGHHENHIPDRGERPDRSRAFPQRRFQPEDRRNPQQGFSRFAIFGQQQQHQNQRHDRWTRIGEDTQTLMKRQDILLIWTIMENMHTILYLTNGMMQ